MTEMDAQSCAMCNKSSQSKSNLTNQQFWINTDEQCRHYFCDKCYQREFAIKRQFSCRRCNRIVNKHHMEQKDIDEIEVERDFSIRKKIKAIYNKSIDSFPNEDDLRDYEEMVEDIIFNLVNNIDVEETNKKVAAYQKEHLQNIAENQSKLQVENDLLREDILRAEELKNQKLMDERTAYQTERTRKLEHAVQLNQIALGERDVMTVSSSATTTSGSRKDDKKDTKPSGMTNSRLLVGAMGGMDTAVTQMSLPPAPSHVLSVLNSRLEPKEIRMWDGTRCKKYDATMSRSMDTAGGYDYITYTQRNWRAIAVEVTRMVTKVNGGKEMDVVEDTERQEKGFVWPLNWQ